MKIRLTGQCRGCARIQGGCALFKHLSYLDDVTETTDLSLKAALEAIVAIVICPRKREK